MIKENKLNEIKKITANKLSLLKNLYEQYGVKYAIENLMPGVTTDLVEYAMEITDNKVFGFCYDSAHDQIDGPNPLDLLERYKNRLFAVHISDRIKEFADHVVPGEGFINFNEISRILGNSEYESTLLMEVMMTNSCYKDPKIFLEKTYIKAKEIMEEINKAGKTSHNRFAAESPLKC
jgi:sugar phosphate isomerase/epimerase